MPLSATDIRKIINSVQKMAGTFNRDLVDVLLCTVDSISTDGFTCACTPISGNVAGSGSQITAVKLNAEKNDGFLITPAIGSTILVGTSTRNNYYVLLYSDIQKITCIIDATNSYEFDSNGFIWNDGLLGGLVKINTLLAKINQLEAFENQVKVAVAAINAAAVSSPGVPVTNATLAAFLVTILPTPVTPTTLLELEDTRIKH